MTLKELIKKNKFKEETFLAFYNKDEKWFFGSFAKDELTLKEYYDMEVIRADKLSDTSSIYKVYFRDYEYPLGLGSMRLKWEKEEKIKKSRK